MQFFYYSEKNFNELKSKGFNIEKRKCKYKNKIYNYTRMKNFNTIQEAFDFLTILKQIYDDIILIGGGKSNEQASIISYMLELPPEISLKKDERNENNTYNFINKNRKSLIKGGKI